MTGETRIHQSEPATAPPSHVSRRQITVHNIELMTRVEPLSNILDQSPDVIRLPGKSAHEVTKIRAVEELLDPAHHLRPVPYLHGFRQNPQDIWRLDRGEELHLASRPLQNLV